MGKRKAIVAASILLLLLAFAPGALAEDPLDQHPRTVVHRVQPIYPEIARRLSLVGLVMVRAEVAADGHVKSVTVVSGNAILAQAAVRAVREWVFAPGAEEGVPVGVTFNLDK
jgi:TonB family protein